jgi:hypothetical protein
MSGGLTDFERLRCARRALVFGFPSTSTAPTVQRYLVVLKGPWLQRTGVMLNWIDIIRCSASDVGTEFALAPVIAVLKADALLAEYGITHTIEASGIRLPVGVHEFNPKSAPAAHVAGAFYRRKPDRRLPVGASLIDLLPDSLSHRSVKRKHRRFPRIDPSRGSMKLISPARPGERLARNDLRRPKNHLTKANFRNLTVDRPRAAPVVVAVRDH